MKSKFTVYKVENLTKKYPEFQLGPLNIEFNTGKITAIVGPNGAGKTTLLSLLIGVRKPNGGKIEFPSIKECSIVGMATLPKNYNLIQLGKLFEHRIDKNRYEKLIKRFNLKEKQLFTKMSAGQRMLSQWALALSIESKALILDEAFNNIDVIFRDIIYKEMSKLIKEKNIPCIITSHNLLEIDFISDEIFFLKNGKILAYVPKPARSVNWFVVDDSKDCHIKLKDNKGIISLPMGQFPEKGKQINLIDVFKLTFFNEAEYEQTIS